MVTDSAEAAREPEARLSALGAAPPADLEALADRILLDAPVEVRRGPEIVTTPLRLPVPGQRSTFVVGHAVLTICEVDLAGTRGDGIVAGREPRGTLAAAICDAEAQRDGPHAASVRELVALVQAGQQSRRAAEAAAVAATRLDEDDEEPS